MLDVNVPETPDDKRQTAQAFLNTQYIYNELPLGDPSDMAKKASNLDSFTKTGLVKFNLSDSTKE